MPPLFALGQQPCRFQLGEMGACRLRGDTGLGGKFARRQGLSGHQRGQHVGPGRVPNQGTDQSDVRSFFHTSTITEA